MVLANLSIYYTRKNIKYEYNNNKFKISSPTWNDEFNLPITLSQLKVGNNSQELKNEIRQLLYSLDH